MQKVLLLVVFMSMVSGISASELQDQVQPESYASRIIACAKSRLFSYAAIAGVGAFGLYKLTKHLMYQAEELMFEEHEHEQELESYKVEKKDYDMVCGLIAAMEQDMVHFEAEPSRVRALELTDFEDTEIAAGCEEMRNFFCKAYEQCLLEPDNKPLLEGIVMIFKQTIEDKMVVA